MRKTSTIILACVLLSCAKENKDVAEELGLVAQGCGTPGARLEATIGGADFCADLQLSAIGGEGSVIVTGIDLGANTLVMQFDDLAIGPHEVSEATNGILFMQTGATWTVPPGSSGTLDVTAHDPVARSFSAHIAAELFHEQSGEAVPFSAQLEVTYSADE